MVMVHLRNNYCRERHMQLDASLAMRVLSGLATGLTFCLSGQAVAQADPSLDALPPPPPVTFGQDRLPTSGTVSTPNPVSVSPQPTPLTVTPVQPVNQAS
ncbi:MAG: hypothetical protein AAGF24_13020, partial [Cyanobacteria bacterium P01_H01_bin.121]